MPQLVALSLSIAVLGAIWAYLALGPLAGFVLVWAGFIAWGCFFHSGADGKGLVKTIVGTAYGAFVAWIALLIVFQLGIASMGLLVESLPAVRRPLSGHPAGPSQDLRRGQPRMHGTAAGLAVVRIQRDRPPTTVLPLAHRSQRLRGSVNAGKTSRLD